MREPPADLGISDKQALLLFTLGPVQRFIAAARKTTDLWAGSALLSHLAEQALAPVQEECGKEAMIFPQVGAPGGSEMSYPNRFVAVVPEGRAEALARRAEASVQKAFEEIANDALGRVGIHEGYARKLANDQVARFLECYWSLLPLDDDEPYGRRYHLLERQLGARKALRDFEQPAEAPGYRCDLIPPLAALVPDQAAKPGKVRNYWKGLAKHQPRSRLRKGEQLSAVALAKRFFPDYQADGHRDREAFPSTSSFAAADFKAGVLEECTSDAKLRTAVEAYVAAMRPLFRTLGAIEDPLPKFEELAEAAGVQTFHEISGEWLFEESFAETRFEDQDTTPSPPQQTEALDALKALKKAARDTKIAPPSKYYALLLLDGDRMGKWLSGKKVPDGRTVDEAYHKAISRALGHFARDHVPRIVEEEYRGRLVYSGGDDVMAFLSFRDALPAARALRAAFSGQLDDEGDIDWTQRRAFSKKNDPDPTLGHSAKASAGLVFAHHMQDLGQVLRRARAAEHYAKDELDRDALALTVMKRSGEHFTTGAKWNEGFDLVETLRRFSDLIRDGALATGFLYDFEDLVRRLGLMPGEHADEKAPTSFEGAEEALRAEAFRLFKRRSKKSCDAHANFSATVSALLDNLDDEEATARRVVKLLDVAQFLAKGGAR